jgi:hypothetical protein
MRLRRFLGSLLTATLCAAGATTVAVTTSSAPAGAIDPSAAQTGSLFVSVSSA